MSNEKTHLTLVKTDQTASTDPFSSLAGDFSVQRREDNAVVAPEIPQKLPTMLPSEARAKMPSMLAPRADEERKVLDQGRLNIYNNMKMAAQTNGAAARDFLGYELALRKQEEDERRAKEAESAERYRLQQEDERIRQAEIELKIRVAELQSRHELEEQRIGNERITAIATLAGQIGGMNSDLQQKLLSLMPTPQNTKRITED